MLVALRLSTTIRLLLKWDSVVVYANKSRGFRNKFSWKENRPRERYSPGPEELGDISVLYNKNFVAGNVSHLVKVCTRHINAFVENRNLPKAQSLFDLMTMKHVEPNVYTYTILMKGYTRVGSTKKVYKLFEEMEKKGVEPSVVTFSTVIEAHAIDGDLEGAQSLFKKMKKSYGLKPTVYTYSAMLKACVRARDLETARSLFHEMKSFGIRPDKITMNTMIDVYAEYSNEDNGKHHLEECRKLLEYMEANGVIANNRTYTTLLKICARGELTGDAMKILAKMRDSHERPDVVSYSTVLDGISKDQKLSDEEVLTLTSRIVNEMKKQGISPDAKSFTSLMNIPLRVGDLYWAERLFKEMKTFKVAPTSVTYGIMIKCYEKLGDPKDGDAYLKPCLDLWHECEKDGMNLTIEGYTSLLSACANASNLDQAMIIWSRMTERKKKVRPDVFAYNAMINAYLIKGQEDKAFELYNKMKTCGTKPSVSTYGTFMSYFMKKKDRSGAQRIFADLKIQGVQPDKAVLRTLKALKID